MLIVQDKLVSDDVIDKQFMCNLNACKGACCWEGDFGAPLTTEELHTLDKIYPSVKPFLTPAGIKVIEEEGMYQYYKLMKDFGTTLIEGAACVFITYEQDGTAKCGIERAYEEGLIDFKKPISCHLYPIRISNSKLTGFEALNYDEWDICSAACKLGEDNQLSVYQFLKEAIIRKYGEEFYEELDAAASYIREE